MKQTQIIMGMPITIDIPSATYNSRTAFIHAFDFFTYVDEKFSTYKSTSEITAVNDGRITPKDYSKDMRLILDLCDATKKETNGYFDIKKDTKIDPSGLVKGWSIHEAAKLLKSDGFSEFYIEAGGDIQVEGEKLWSIGIRNPFNIDEIVKVIKVQNSGVATSGSYIRGQHVYNPKKPNQELKDIVSLTVIGPNIYEADRFATAAFAMQREGINFIEHLTGFEAYSVAKDGIATMTSGFESYL